MGYGTGARTAATVGGRVVKPLENGKLGYKLVMLVIVMQIMQLFLIKNASGFYLLAFFNFQYFFEFFECSGFLDRSSF
jgi:hypothetical protein